LSFAISVSALADATGVERQDSKAGSRGCRTPAGESRHGGTCDDCVGEKIRAFEPGAPDRGEPVA
jgi:hypothetical protein